MTQLAISNVGVDFGATTIFDGITFTIAAGERWGVIGRNGTGKTTLFKLLTGQLTPTRGQIARQPGVRVTLLEQHRDFGGAAMVWDAVASAFAPLIALEHSLAEQAHALADHASEEALARYGHDLERFERDGGYTYSARVDAVLHGLDFDPDEARTRLLSTLSGGERGRVGLGRQLVIPGDVLLLDEPTNHLDLETTRWLEDYLRTTERSVVLVSHDRAFLAAVADHVLHFEAGTATPYVGSYESFIQQHAEKQLTQQRQFDKQRRVVSAEQDYIARNLAGQNSKQAKGRRKRLERMARLSPPPGEEDVMALRLQSGDRGGDQVLVAEDAAIAVPSAEGGPRVLIEEFTTRLVRGETVGFVGPNGAGKSSLLRTLVGDRPVAGGELRLGGSIDVAYYRQDLTQVPLDRTLYDIIADLRPGWERRMVQGHLGRFGFSGDEVQRRAASLSGGERARVALAMMMLSRANLLILDEPTNHLDVESIEALEDALDAFDGTVIVVSHDRALLRGLATQVWELRDRRITTFDGSFAEWEETAADRERAAAKRASADAEQKRARERVEADRRTEASRKAAEAERGAAAKQGAAKATGRDDAGSRDEERELRRRTRDAERLVREAEMSAGGCEGRIAELTRALDDAGLYGTPAGVERAAALGAELARVRTQLDRAMEAWARASEELEAMGRGAGGAAVRRGA